jgi:hypothetical protein
LGGNSNQNEVFPITNCCFTVYLCTRPVRTL